jgi:Leucine-rich repeat (LRR) protein
VKPATPAATTLDLSSLRLYELPPDLANLTDLTELNIANNRLTELPDWITDLQGLTNLSIRSNDFKVFPSPILALTGLRSLVTNYNNSVPERVRHGVHQGQAPLRTPALL